MGSCGPAASGFSSCTKAPRTHHLTIATPARSRGRVATVNSLDPANDAAIHLRRSLGAPGHVAMILDGNGRWAEARGLTRTAGHEEGSIAASRAVWACLDRGLPNVTLYTFSVGNWGRPKAEVDALMRISAEFVEREGARFIELPRHPRPRRRRARRSSDTQCACAARGTSPRRPLQQHRHDPRLFAVNYGGRRERSWRPCLRSPCTHAPACSSPKRSTSRPFAASWRSLPEPPRSGSRHPAPGGDSRLSDFLRSSRCAHAELFFTETLWPDFDASTLDLALAAFARRRRRLSPQPEAGAATTFPSHPYPRLPDWAPGPRPRARLCVRCSAKQLHHRKRPRNKTTRIGARGSICGSDTKRKARAAFCRRAFVVLRSG